MGQFISWIRGPRDNQGLQDVAVEEQSQPKQATPTPAAQVSKVKPAQYESTTVPSGKSEPAKKAPAGVSKPSAPAGAAAPKGLDAKAKELKVQAELKAPAAKAAVQELDPFEALAGSLPPSEPLAPKAPVYTGPEVKEAKKMPAGVPDKPKETPKPMSTDEALDSLSAGFGFSPDPVKDKMETVESASTAAKNFAPLPPPAQKSAAPPLDKKAKMEKGVPMSLDALSALEDTLPAHVPEPEPPKLRPEDIVKAPKVKSEDAVRVGERDDTLPPDYRFTEEELQKYPAPKPEPTLDTDAALDLLSGDFVTPAASASVQAPVPPSAPKQSVEELDALDALAGDFAGCHAPELAVCSPLNTAVLKPDEIAVCPPGPDPAVLAVCPPANTAVLHPDELAAMDALSDLLPDSAPAPAPVPIPTKDIVQEKKVEEEKIIKMGERDDTLPPEFRLSEEEKEAMKKAAADAKPEKPSMDNATALDLLADDFSDPVAPTAVIPAETALKTKSVAPPAQQEPCIVAPGPVLDELASTLIPSTLEARPKETRSKGKSGKSKSKSKKHAAAEDPTATLDLAGPAGTNVVSTKKGGKS